MIRSVLKKFYSSLTVGCFFLFPFELSAGDVYLCGDWQCSSFGHAMTWNDTEQNETQRYHILLVKNENNGFLKYHYLSPGVLDLKKGDNVTFKFDNLIEIRVPVIDTTQDRVVFSPLDFVLPLETHLKKEIQFSIHKADQKLAGPFSLVGSKKAINTAIEIAVEPYYSEIIGRFHYTLSNLPL